MPCCYSSCENKTGKWDNKWLSPSESQNKNAWTNGKVTFDNINTKQV